MTKFCEHCEGLSSGVVVSTPHPYSGHRRFDSQGKCRLDSDFSLFSADTARKMSYALLKHLSRFVTYNKTISTMESRQSLYSLIIHYQVLGKRQRFGVSLPCLSSSNMNGTWMTIVFRMCIDFMFLSTLPLFLTRLYTLPISCCLRWTNQFYAYLACCPPPPKKKNKPYNF